MAAGVSTYKKVTVRNGQSSLDVCLENYGCIDALLQLIADNPDVYTSIDMVPQPGTVLKVLAAIPDYNNNNKAIAKEYAKRKYLTASGLVYLSPSDPVTTEGGFSITTEGGLRINMEQETLTDETGDAVLTESQRTLGG